MDKTCFVGLPDLLFCLLAGEGTPQAPLDDEVCHCIERHARLSWRAAVGIVTHFTAVAVIDCDHLCMIDELIDLFIGENSYLILDFFLHGNRAHKRGRWATHTRHKS